MRGPIPVILADEDDLRPDGRLIYKDPARTTLTLFDNSAILAAWESGDDSGCPNRTRRFWTRQSGSL